MHAHTYTDAIDSIYLYIDRHIYKKINVRISISDSGTGEGEPFCMTMVLDVGSQ